MLMVYSSIAGKSIAGKLSAVNRSALYDCFFNSDVLVKDDNISIFTRYE
jgi:hypothetical protein